MEIQIGTVKKYFPEKGYGFLSVEGSEDVFFHIRDMRSMEPGRAEPKWVPPQTKFRSPQPGDRIAFIRSYEQKYEQKGPRAKPWTYAKIYEWAQKVTANRPHYRVRKQYRTVGSGEWDEPSTVWEGDDLEDSQLKLVWDPRYDRSFFSCGDFDSRMWFEKKAGDRPWVECPDPR